VNFLVPHSLHIGHALFGFDMMYYLPNRLMTI